MTVNLVYKDRVKETTTTEGTGPITLAGAVTGYSSFASRLTTGDVCAICIEDTTRGEWEVCKATLTAATTLGRGSLYDTSASGARINFGAGTKDVYLVLPAPEIELLEKVAVTFPLSDETTVIATSTSALTVRAPFGLYLTDVRGSLVLESSSGSVQFDVNVSGSTILSTKLTIDANEKTSTTAATAVVISSRTIADDAEISFDIDTPGAGAKGAKVTLIGVRV